MKAPKNLSKHHRLPRSLNDTSRHPPGNVVKIPCHRHRAWHTLVGNLDVERIAETLSQYIDPRYVLVPVRKEEA
jgi:hypothetical protein